MECDRIIYKILLDLFVIALVGLALLLVVLFAEPHERGYFENDQSIRLPFKEESITEGLLIGLCFALIIVTVIPTEAVRYKRVKGVKGKFYFGKLVPSWIWESYRAIGIYSFGALCQQLTVTTGKYVLGRLRPNFIDVCRPVPNPSSTLNQLGYIADYTCTGTNLALIKNGRFSFPSGHSSFAMYTAVYFIFYVQTKGKWHGSKLLRHGLQYAILMAAWYVGMSRVVENKHHWSDIAGGYSIGAIFAVFCLLQSDQAMRRGTHTSYYFDQETETNCF